MDNQNNTCTICKKTFSERYNLRAHVKKFHPDKLEELVPHQKFKCTTVCNECNKSFVKNSNLTQHVKKYHKDKLLDLIKPKQYNYSCEKCPKRFTHLRHFKSHKRSYHKENANGCFQCILCQNAQLDNFSKLSLYDHFRIRHDISIHIEVLQFNNLEEFETWKKQEEERTNELFVNTHGAYKNKNFMKIEYECHRSGFYIKKGNDLRHLKMQGSKKIDGYCPAAISVRSIKDKFEVKYVSTHVGHSNNLGHRENISRKLKELRKRHKNSINLDIASIKATESGWLIPSSSTNETYQLEERKTSCQNCKLLCTYCNKCIHNYTCSCIDNRIKYNMCKHIHMLARYLEHIRNNSGNGATQSSQTENKPQLFIDENETANSKEISRFVNTLTSKTASGDNVQFMSDRENFKLQICHLIDDLADYEELNIAKKAVAPIMPTVTAFRHIKSKNMGVGQQFKTMPHNKKISQQRSLHRTKKNMFKKKKQISKPDCKEMDEAALNMLEVLLK